MTGLLSFNIQIISASGGGDRIADRSISSVGRRDKYSQWQRVVESNKQTSISAPTGSDCSNVNEARHQKLSLLVGKRGEVRVIGRISNSNNIDNDISANASNGDVITYLVSVEAYYQRP